MRMFLIPTTTRNQSERLIELGLNLATADCFIDNKSGNTHYLTPGADILEMMKEKDAYPSWTLDKLSLMFPPNIMPDKEDIDKLNSEARKRNLQISFEAKCKSDYKFYIFGDYGECCVFLFEKFKEMGYIDKRFLKNVSDE